jgi:hypothetical protein
MRTFPNLTAGRIAPIIEKMRKRVTGIGGIHDPEGTKVDF